MNNFKYVRNDFGNRDFKLIHMNIKLDFKEEKVFGDAELRLITLNQTKTITFDCKVAEVQSVECCMRGEEKFNVDWNYDTKQNKLFVNINEELHVGSEISVYCKTVCIPGDSILEGIYKDVTYKGPQQYISQCQQWGFQRILPVFDDCTAKCTMRTTIEADAAYTHLISNGDVCRETNPDGIPVMLEDKKRQTITYDLKIPMAPYLFLVAVGCWDVLDDEFVYKSGHKVKLEYLVPPGHIKGAIVPMKILKDSIAWHEKTQNYEYPFEVYRTICMEKSNWGGMENLGNTTIVTDAALIDEFTGDKRWEYAHAVIIHEFEHNQCGSEVTMETPFDVWLNEAFTVDVERQYMHHKFDPCWQRLEEVDEMRAPVGGPLAVEDGGQLGNIVREGFNDPDELIDGLTYVKSAEIIRMLRLVVGQDNFIKSKDLYFARYHGANANSDQFFECFEEVSGLNLSQFKHEWLYTIGYPIVTAEYSYSKEEKKLSINISQERSNAATGNFVIPLNFALVDKNGNDIFSGQLVVSKQNENFIYNDIQEFEFISWNRDCCFYGVFNTDNISDSELFKQARRDPSDFNRVQAMESLTDKELIKLIDDPKAKVSEKWVDLYGEILQSEMKNIIKSYMINISDIPLTRKYIPYYEERITAQTRLITTVCQQYLQLLVDLFQSIDTTCSTGDYSVDIAARRLKFAVLKILSTGNVPEAYGLAEKYFNDAVCITDRMNALICLNLCSHSNKEKVFNAAYDAYKDNSTAYRQYLAAVASGDKNCLELIRKEENRQSFNLSHPGHVMGLYLAAASNNKVLWTDDGLAWMEEAVTKLAEVNEYFANRMVDCFRLTAKMQQPLRTKVQKCIKNIIQKLDSKSYVAKTLKSFLTV